MSEKFIGREEEIANISEQLDAGKTLGVIEGHAGIGKSALAREFADRQKARFPGGIEFVRGFDDEQLKKAIAGIRASSLLVVDDAEGLDPSIVESIRQINKSTKNFNALFTTRLAPTLEAIRKSQEAFRVQLEPFSKIDFTQFAKQFEIPNRLRENIAALTQQSPLMLRMTSELVARHEYQWSEIANALRDFEYPGLVDPEGRPLDADSEERKLLVTDIKEINDEVLELLKKDPSAMRGMHPRDFEKLIAELLDRAGYETELTPATNDGGVDIYAARRDGLGRFLYLVECKRYAEKNPVGVQVVRSLHGVVQQQRANGGLVVTSSFFTKGAKEFTSEINHQMHLHDYINIQKWLRTLGT